MAHLIKQQYDGSYWTIETTDGSTFLPGDVQYAPDCWPRVGGVPVGIEIGLSDFEDADILRNSFGYFVEGGGESITSIEYHTAGTLYRLSAPGYSDSTDWTTDPDSPEFEEG